MMPGAWHRVGAQLHFTVVIFTIFGLFIRKVGSGVQILDWNSWSIICLLSNLIPILSLR